MKTALVMAGVAACHAPSMAAIALTGSSRDWTSLGDHYDFLDDQQTGRASGDIVGTAADPGFFIAYDDAGSSDPFDGELGFRVRLDDHGGNRKSPEFDRNLWIGLDADTDGGIDAFLGLNRQGSSSELAIYAPGDGSNRSPNTTSIAKHPYRTYELTGLNYDYRLVDYLYDGGTTNDLTPKTSGDGDYYVSFMMPLGDIVAFLHDRDPSNPVTPANRFRYIVATSTQSNVLNQDLGGVEGGTDSTARWSDTGGFTAEVTPTAVLASVPEPSCVAILGLGLMAFPRSRRR